MKAEWAKWINELATCHHDWQSEKLLHFNRRVEVCKLCGERRIYRQPFSAETEAEIRRNVAKLLEEKRSPIEG